MVLKSLLLLVSKRQFILDINSEKIYINDYISFHSVDYCTNDYTIKDLLKIPFIFKSNGHGRIYVYEPMNKNYMFISSKKFTKISKEEAIKKIIIFKLKE
tara:strand:- start:1358 stop:1657 length:300 start_codon:yes stop_codon:yes gene_type:complete